MVLVSKFLKVSISILGLELVEARFWISILSWNVMWFRYWFRKIVDFGSILISEVYNINRLVLDIDFRSRIVFGSIFDIDFELKCDVILDIDFEKLSILDRFWYRKYDINRHDLDIDFRSRTGFGSILDIDFDLKCDVI